MQEPLIKIPWAFIWVPYMNPTILGLYAQGFLVRPFVVNPNIYIYMYYRILTIKLVNQKQERQWRL